MAVWLLLLSGGLLVASLRMTETRVRLAALSETQQRQAVAIAHLQERLASLPWAWFVRSGRGKASRGP